MPQSTDDSSVDIPRAPIELFYEREYGVFVNNNAEILNPIGMFNIYRDFDDYQRRLSQFRTDKLSVLSPEEIALIEIELDPKRKIIYTLSQNHVSNYLEQIYETYVKLCNGTSDLTGLSTHEKLLDSIADHIISLWKDVISISYNNIPLKKFYDRKMVIKFIDSLSFVKPSPKDIENDVKNVIRNRYWNEYFNPAAEKVRSFLLEILPNFSDERPGLCNFDDDLYDTLLKMVAGTNNRKRDVGIATLYVKINDLLIRIVDDGIKMFELPDRDRSNAYAIPYKLYDQICNLFYDMIKNKTGTTIPQLNITKIQMNMQHMRFLVASLIDNMLSDVNITLDEVVKEASIFLKNPDESVEDLVYKFLAQPGRAVIDFAF
jgi:hypothetical protein